MLDIHYTYLIYNAKYSIYIFFKKRVWFCPQVILSSKSNGETRMTELKTRAQSLCDHKELQEDKKLEVEKTVKDTEEQWRTVLQAADDTHRYRKLYFICKDQL